MRSDETVSGKAFLARRLRKLDRAATFVKAHGIAEEARQERERLAREIEAIDQARMF
jgi:hypothetical protein